MLEIIFFVKEISALEGIADIACFSMLQIMQGTFIIINLRQLVHEFGHSPNHGFENLHKHIFNTPNHTHFLY